MIGVIMPRYIIERTLPKMSQDEMQQLARRSIQVADGIPGVVWIKSYISESEGKTYCEYEAPNPESLLEHARLLNISAEKITRVEIEVHPGMFR
jgi:Nickel responsive protein SCO4226-like